jgi:hypothetical protein
VFSPCSGVVEWKGGESGATGPTTAEGVGWWNVTVGLSTVPPMMDDEDSGLECGDGVRGGLEIDGRG